MVAESCRPWFGPSWGPTGWVACWLGGRPGGGGGGRAGGGGAWVEPVQINGCPALIIRLNGEIDDVVAVRIDDGLITGLYAVRNPEKLSRVERETAVSRWDR